MIGEDKRNGWPDGQPFRCAMLRMVLLVFPGLRLVGIVVVFLVVDLPAVLVLFAVDLLALLIVESTAVGGALVVHLLVDAGLVRIGAGSFAGSFLTGA